MTHDPVTCTCGCHDGFGNPCTVPGGCGLQSADQRTPGCSARPCVVCHDLAHDTGQDCRVLARETRAQAIAEGRARGWRDYEPEPDPRASCPVRAHNLGMTCTRCRDRMRRQLHEIPELYALAGGELTPGSSTGGRGTEPSLGLRVGALDLRQGADIIGILASWDRAWSEWFDEDTVDWTRRSPHDTDPVGATLVAVTKRLGRDLDRACATHPAIDDFERELNEVYRGARSAARTMEARHTEIECPNDRDDGICGARIRIGGLELNDVVHCPRCARRWELHRLLLVAASDQASGSWLPVEDVALLYGVSRPTLNRWAKEGRVQRSHGLFELRSVRDAIAKGTGKGASA